MPTIEGSLSAAGLSFAIVASRFNGLIVEPRIAGALDVERPHRALAGKQQP